MRNSAVVMHFEFVYESLKCRFDLKLCTPLKVVRYLNWAFCVLWRTFSFQFLMALFSQFSFFQFSVLSTFSFRWRCSQLRPIIGPNTACSSSTNGLLLCRINHKSYLEHEGWRNSLE